MSSPRRSARISAVQILYALALGKAGKVVNERFDAHDACQQFWQHFEAPADAKSYAEKLVAGTVAALTDIDEVLARSSKNWRIERMAKMDLTILRVATYELLFCADIPHEVAIDEAVELAKLFSTSDAAQFINGVLAPVVDERRVRFLTPSA